MSSLKVLKWSIVIATAVSSLSLVRLVTGSPPPKWDQGALQQLVYMYAWALEIPILTKFFIRCPLSFRSLPMYSAVGCVAALPPIVIERTLPGMNGPFILSEVAGFLSYWVIVAILQAVLARVAARELQVQLAQAQLQNLRSQLHPHFLFNTLHTISVLMRQDVEASNRVLLKLSDLLRTSLDSSRSEKIALQQELEFLENYLAIEQTRFDERLRVSTDAGADARVALIPALLLQPFVENAVRHGIAARVEGGHLWISASRRGSTLELRVENDGAELAGDFAERRARGCGIRNTEERLRAMYSDRAQLTIAPRTGGGVAVRVTLPYEAP